MTYGTNSEFGFDYLRDNLATDVAEKSQRGHGFAIVDEVDNILIDEARTPLIISGQPEQAADLYFRFAALAPKMESGQEARGPRAAKDKSWVADFDFEFDEKHKTVAVTEHGVAKAEKFLGIDNLYKAENGHLVNHLQQSLKAESLYKRGVDYEVIDGEVKIIDEFTGRILEGRRWSEGLHQAVEAKEGVAIQEENQTVATITYQNYFRRYEKLGGMTGTAITEATEFMKIYELQVVEIPTNRPMARVDQNDQIYKTKGGKWAAVTRQIKERHEAGQPVLVGTISVEVSEVLSEELNRHGIEHTVLNAKPEYAELEGETIAEAGRPGAVTIATNMAGRGVDIKLGGNAEHLTEVALRDSKHEPGTPEYDKAWDETFPTFEAQVERDREMVKEAGGLYILGTERHESRRIDNQLRGRSGRQGDPGESRFFLSAEDDLVRLFAGDRIYRILDRLGPVGDEGEEEPIEAKMLSKQIEGAQKKVEEQNFLIRKRVLEYDDVMNQQREIIYEYRDKILEGEDMSETAREELPNVVERIASEYMADDFTENWDLSGLYTQLEQMYPCGIEIDQLDPNQISREGLIADLREDVVEAYADREEELGRRAHARARALHAAPDHRRALARAPARHGLPARGNPPAWLRPDRSPRRVQERGLRDVHLAHELGLGGVRPLHLRRRGRRRGRGRQRRRGALRGRPATGAGPRTPPRRASSPTRAEPPPTSPAPSRRLPPPAARARPRLARTASTPTRRSRRPPSSRRARSTRRRRPGATTRAGAGRARSSRSAMGPSRGDYATSLRDRLTLLADYL